MSTAREIITQALLIARVIDPDESISDAYTQRCLRRMNDMLDMWSLEGLTILTLTEDTYTMVIGKNTYTIGTSGTPDISTVMPVKIDQAFMRDTVTTPSLDYYLDCGMTQEDYNKIPVKGISSIPTGLFYDPSYPNSTIYFDYAPNKAFELHLFSRKPITSLATLDSDISLPIGYESAIISNLAPLYAEDNGREPTQLMVANAVRSLRNIKNNNAVTLYAESSGSLASQSSRRFNIKSGI